MKIAHFSDLHVLALDGVPVRRFINKRLTGWANLRLKRRAAHHTAYVRAIASEVARRNVDHVVVTGDLTNLALETEFACAREVLGDMGFDPSRVTIVPGNHDVYTRGALTSRRFERYFDAWLASDLPELGGAGNGSRFPVVKLRGPAAIIGLSSAVPRAPFIAAGEIGRPQLNALARILAHAEVLARTVILALHHPVLGPPSAVKNYTQGLRDAADLLTLLRPLPRGLVIHGHLHKRLHKIITTTNGHLDHVGATSASLHDDRPDRMAGFNLYELASGGAIEASAVVYEPDARTFRDEPLPA